MKISILAVGRLKSGAEQTQFNRYFDLFNASARALKMPPMTVLEIGEGRSAQESCALPALSRTHDLTPRPCPHRPCRTTLPRNDHHARSPLPSRLRPNRPPAAERGIVKSVDGSRFQRHSWSGSRWSFSLPAARRTFSNNPATSARP